MDLQGKSVLVTGAARRVGRAIALRLAEGRPHLLLHYHRSRAEAEEVAALAEKKGARATLFPASFDDSAGVRGLIDAIRRAGLGVDVLVNNASIFGRVPLEAIDEAHWDAMHMVNAKAPFLLAQAFGPEMKRRGAGKIVNIADVSAENPWKSYLAYCASKAALLNVTRGLAKALAPEVQV
ncbi:MAG: SDR family NAD(P)-dependent oxidoreductase, partial [Candidatus Methylomirabilis sp.]|nr:SDR family NAD(P)-dependent oxidoreductase [Deltaproteobacteria bacterium]